MDARARRIKDATGAAFPSPVVGEWPAWWSDAVAHLELMQVLETNARIQAQRNRDKEKHGRV